MTLNFSVGSAVLLRIVPIGLSVAALAGGCASSGTMTIKEVSTATRAAEAAPAPLTRSLFEKPRERENLSEDAIQKIVNAPVEPDFPARAGVVVLSRPFTRSSYPSLEPGDEAPQLLAREIERSRHFVMVSDISPYLADGQHVESLRELATRYRLKYLVVVNVRYADRLEVNHWAWGWLSLLGFPFLPAFTLQTAGLMEATLLDVRTGTFLFTAQVHAKASNRTTPIGTDEKFAQLQRATSRKAAEKLAQLFLGRCNRLVAEVERQRNSAASAEAEKARSRAKSETRGATSPAPAPGAASPGGA